MKKMVFLLSIVLLGCGSGSGATAVTESQVSSSQPLAAPQVINGIGVPPEPDAAVNNATLLGIDSNNNGVRDDVERQIAVTYGANPARYYAVMRAALSDQEYLIANGDPVESTTTTSHAVIAGACMNRKFNNDAIAASKASRDSFAMSINTSERMAAYRATSSASTEVGTDIPANPCQ